MTVRYVIQKKFYSTKIKANPKYWLKKAKEVSEKHPFFEDVNRQIQELKNKKFYAENKYKNKRFTIQQVINYMAGKCDYSTVMSYVNTVMKESKSDQNYKGFRSAVRSFENTLETTLTFENLMANSYKIFEAYNIAFKKRVKAEEVSPTSYNTYVKNLGIILSYAYKQKDIYERVDVPDEFKSMSVDELEIRSFSTKDVEDRIEKIETIYDFKAISVWLLMFSLRGMYQADIVTMREDRVEDGKRNKTSRKLTSWWNDQQYIHHKRSKTGVNMLIKLHKQSVLKLLQMVKNVIVFLDYPNENRKNIVASINSKVEIYNYDPLENESYHKNIWKKTQEKLSKKFDGLAFKTARKSYTTLMETLKYEDKMIKVQVGQSNDMLLKRSYKNYRDPELMKIVDETHLNVLGEFKVQELTEMLADKLKDVIRNDNLPKWLMGHSGVHKVGRAYKILVGTVDKTKPVFEEIEPKYKDYFMSDESKSNDFWNDIKEQEKEIFGDKLKFKGTLQKVFNEIHNKDSKSSRIMQELRDKQKNSKALKSLLTETGIEQSK